MSKKQELLEFLESSGLGFLNESISSSMGDKLSEYLEIDGSYNGKEVYVKINLTDVDYNYTPPERGYRDSYGAPYEPDYPAEYDLENYVATATLMDEEDNTLTIGQDKFPEFITSYQDNGKSLNLKEFLELMLNEYAEDFYEHFYN